MGMREECKHFQSRTYDNGEVARFCVLGNAPDQPFSCPESCLTYERRFADVGWSHGSLVTPPTPEASDTPENREAVLAAASEIVGAVAPQLFEERRAEIERLQRRAERGWRFWRR
jgi:hypothetical protein